jgi:hypothetical protein
MGQITEDFARQMIVHCERKEHPPLTVWEAEQLAYAWLALEAARRKVAEQAENDGLWFIAESCAEGYLQQELRALAAVIETPNV